MSSLFSGTTRFVASVVGLLLVCGAVAFADNNSTVAKILAGPAKDMIATRTSTQQPVSARPLVKISLAGVVERDSKKISVEKANPVSPGEVVIFTLNSVNEGDAPAREFRAIGQIPRGSIFVGGSASSDGGTQVTYSIDNGKQFSDQPMIDEKQADGTIKKVPAPVSMYTQVRFGWADPLAAGAKVAATYQVRVK